MTSRRQGIARLVVGVVAAVWAGVTLYFVGAFSVALVYAAAFAIAWIGARVWLRSGRWRSRLGYGTIAITLFLASFLSNLVTSTTSDEFSTRMIGAVMSLMAGLTLSVWFSRHRWEKIG